MAGNDVWMDLSQAAVDVDGNPVFLAIYPAGPAKGLLYTCSGGGRGAGGGGSTSSSAVTACDPSELVLVSPTSNLSLALSPSSPSPALSMSNASLYFSLADQGAFYPYLNFSYLAYDADLDYTLNTITLTLKCAPGTIPNIWLTTGDACVTCPTGAQCSSDGNYAPYPFDGYYAMPTPAGMAFTSCNPVTACVGGYNGGCGRGYTGKVCGGCSFGYARLDTQCVECPSPMLWLTAVITAGLVVLTCLALALLSRHRLSFSSLYILLVFAQTLTIFNHYHLRWPTAVSSLFTSLSVASFNVDLFVVSCYIPHASYSNKWVATVLILPTILVLLFLAYAALIAVAYTRHRLSPRRHPYAAFATTLRTSTSTLLRYATIWLFITALPFLTKGFELFSCSTLPDLSRIFNPDPSLLCTDPWYSALYPITVLYLCLLALFVGIWVGGGVSKHVPRKVEWGAVGWGRLKWWRLKEKGMGAGAGGKGGGREGEKVGQGEGKVGGVTRNGKGRGEANGQGGSKVTWSLDSAATTPATLTSPTSLLSPTATTHPHLPHLLLLFSSPLRLPLPAHVLLLLLLLLPSSSLPKRGDGLLLLLPDLPLPPAVLLLVPHRAHPPVPPVRHRAAVPRHPHRRRHLRAHPPPPLRPPPMPHLPLLLHHSQPARASHPPLLLLHPLLRRHLQRRHVQPDQHRLLLPLLPVPSDDPVRDVRVRGHGGDGGRGGVHLLEEGGARAVL